MKVAPDPVMSEVVRQRLELLLAEVRPRHALADDPVLDEPALDEPALDQRALDQPAPGGSRDAVGVGRGGEGPGAPDPAARAAGQPPRRARSPEALVTRAGRQLVEFTREHLVAVVLVLVVGCGWTVYSLLQARSTPVAAAAVPSVVASPPPSASATPTPASVLVHVLGAVRSPGLVRLAEGSRVADVIAAAGGLSRSADPAELNLAAVVADGSQVVIGTRTKPRGEVRGAGEVTAGAGTPAGSAGGATVSLNTATLDQLDTLPGVGPVTAQKILNWRGRHGRFTAVSELQEVDGIGPRTYADIAPHVRV